MMHSLRLDHVSLRVRSLERSTEFYAGVLGFAVMPDNPAYPTIRWFEIGGLDALHITEGDLGDTKVSKTNHFAVRVADFDALVLDLRRRGTVFYDWAGSANNVTSRPDGFRQVYLRDPDGYWVEVNDHTQTTAKPAT
jgi:catechol 2,3-dioxygenase-like lactoylglutathione lyase family enzyme